MFSSDYGSPEDINAIKELRLNFQNAFIEKNATAFPDFFESSAMLKPAPNKSFIRGKEQIGEALQEFLSADIDMKSLETCIYINEGVALIRSRWEITGKNPSAGEALEVLRKQADGKWLYYIDMPMGC